MSVFSDYAEDQIIKHMFRTGSWTKPAALWARLWTAAPGEAGGGTEVVGGSYAAQNLPPLDANWAATVTGNGSTNNLVAITYPAPTANWGTVNAVSLEDAASAGNELVYSALTTPKTVNNGDAAPSFAIGALVVTVA
jgi:hypothetical protein